MIFSFLLTIVLSGESLCRLAVEYVEKELGTPPSNCKWEVLPLTTPAQVVMPDTNYKLEIELPRGINRAGATFGWININGVKKAPIAFKVKILKPTVVTSRRIWKHEILSKNDLQIELRECADTNATQEIEKVDSLIGMRARNAIPAGATVTKEMIEPPPIVNKGERVTVIFEKEGIIISTKGISEEDGWLNDIITVKRWTDRFNSRSNLLRSNLLKKNKKGDRVYSAQVMDKGIVKGVL